MIAELLLILKKIWDNRKLALGVLTAFLVLLCYVYYLKTSHTIETLTKQNTELQQIVEQQKRAIETIKKDYTKIIEIKEDLNKQVVAAQKNVEELRQKLYRENQGKKPLEELATRKTSLIEKIVNKGTQNVLKCFELLSEDKEC